MSLAGARTGAITAANELGIDLWGPDELQRHLGPSVFADVAGPAPVQSYFGQIAWAYPFAYDAVAARQLVEKSGKGRFGMRTLEPVVWFEPVWFPAFATQLTVAQPVTQRMRQRLNSIVVTNLYDAVGGNYLGSVPAGLVEMPLGHVVAVKPLRREAQIDGGIRKALEARSRVSTQAAIQRHDSHLRELGLPVPCRSVAVERTTLVYIPIYAGMLATPSGARVVAVGGATGNISDRLSAILTSNLAYLRQSFGG